MKRILLAFLFLANSTYAEVDVFQWCQAQIDMVKNFSTLSPGELVAIKTNIAKADSVEKLSLATGKDFNSMIGIVQNHQNISEEKARKVVMSSFKPIEIKRINEAIAMQGVIDELKWNKEFDKCVESNRDSL